MSQISIHSPSASALTPTDKSPLPRVGVTPFGATVLVLIIVTLLMAVNYSNNLLYAVAYIWIALFITSGLKSWLQFRKVTPSGWQHGQLYAGVVNTLTLSVNSTGFDGILFLAGGDIHDQHCVWHYSPESPGRYHLMPPKLCAVDPLKLWQFRQRLPAIRDQLIFARPVEHLPFHRAFKQVPSAELESEDISGLRDYQVTDDFRHIDWSATARSGRYVVREWEGIQRKEQFWLSWNDLAPLSRRQRQETLTAWVIKLFDQQHAWGLELPNVTIATAADWQHRNHCLQLIAEVSN